MKPTHSLHTKLKLCACIFKFKVTVEFEVVLGATASPAPPSPVTLSAQLLYDSGRRQKPPEVPELDAEGNPIPKFVPAVGGEWPPTDSILALDARDIHGCMPMHFAAGKLRAVVKHASLSETGRVQSFKFKLRCHPARCLNIHVLHHIVVVVGLTRKCVELERPLSQSNV